MIRRLSALAALLFVAIPAGLAFGSHRAADVLGSALGRDAASALRDLPAFTRRAAAAPLVEAAAEAETVSAASTAKQPVMAGRETTVKGRAKPRAARSPQADRGVFVSAQAVLGLASRRAMPRAVPVAAAGTRPAGLRLVGAAALGIGMRDGDILTQVQGAPAGSVAAVVEAVLRARANNARVISGVFWRDGRALPLAVEQPYGEALAPTSSSP